LEELYHLANEDGGFRPLDEDRIAPGYQPLVCKLKKINSLNNTFQVAGPGFNGNLQNASQIPVHDSFI